jgi:hypothetical protein
VKYFEISEPYYALISANNFDEALRVYVECVSEDDGTLREELREVDHDYALVKYSRGVSENGEPQSISELLSEFRNGAAGVLLIDGSLI